MSTSDRELMACTDLDKLAGFVKDGSTVVLPADYGGSPGAFARALVRAGRKNLDIVGGPPSGYVADLLIGAGCVRSIECPGVILGDFGLANRFRDAVATGKISVLDTTCPAFHASIAAAQRGLPFMPIRGLIGSDVLKHQTRWKVVPNPFGAPGVDELVAVIPAFVPEIFIFHARYGDRHGNVWIGKNFEVKAIAQAAKTVLATFENLYEGNLLEDEKMAPSTVANFYVTATAHVKGGSYPIIPGSARAADPEHLRKYAEMSRTAEGFQAYVDQFVMGELVEGQ